MLVVYRQGNLDIDEFATKVTDLKPRWVIPPWDISRPNYTSRCAERARAALSADCPFQVGVVLSGSSDEDRMHFFVWAQGQKFSPIVFLPHARKARMRQVLDVWIQGYVNAGTHIHLPGFASTIDFTEDSFPGVVFTTGEEF
jgi:hypothetical protein